MRDQFGIQHVAAMVLAITTSGCSLSVPATYVAPSEVTLPQAMKDLACGIKTFQNEGSRLGFRSGTWIDQAEVTLNLKASATGTSTLVVDAKPAVPANVMASLGINYTDKTELVGERGNQIKITLKNIYTSTLNDPGKAAVKKANIPLDLGPGVLYPSANPCEPQLISPEDLEGAVGINSPTRKRS